MAVSRIEKFKEYRNSIILNGSPDSKATIDTTLKVAQNENVDNYTKELQYAKRLNIKKGIEVGLFLLFITAILILLIVYGLKFF